MEYKNVKKLIIWLALTALLFLAFFIGILVTQRFELSFLIFGLIVADYVLVSEAKLENVNLELDKKILIWLFLLINLSFAFIIGLTLPLLISANRDMMAYIMIPLLIILNYIILDRLHYYQKHAINRLENKDER